MEVLKEDCKTIWYQIRHEEKVINSKRRWLMGFPTSPKLKKKQLKRPKFLKNVSLPESLLREDDVSFDSVKTCIERGFEVFGEERVHDVAQEHLQLFDTNMMPANMVLIVFSMLDDLNNNALCLLANIVTGSTVKFEKTRWRMKRVIKEYLRKILRNKSCKVYNMEVIKKLSQVLKDPHNFQKKLRHMEPLSQSSRTAATKVLEGLEDMPFQALSAMRRKLRGIQGGIPQLKPPKSGWSRERLIEQVRKISNKMLSELGEADELQGPLAKAMAVADLSFKLTTRCQDSSIMKFCQFSPEIEALQREILNAIWMTKRVKSSELNEMLLLLDPKAESPNRSLRTGIRKMLIEYLFDCSDMDVIPKPLLETLDIINKSSRSTVHMHFSKEEIEEEIECVSSVSSQTRQIIWDLLPDHEFDQEFSDAYMEELEESDTDGYDDNEQQYPSEMKINQFYSNDTKGQAEGIGESREIDCTIPTTSAVLDGTVQFSLFNRNSNNGSTRGSEPEHLPKFNSADLHEVCSSSSNQELNCLNEMQNMTENKYLAIQEISDQTSLLAYKLIGHLLDEFSQIQDVNLDWSKRAYLRGGDFIPADSQVSEEMLVSSEDDMELSLVRVVEELIPSFPKSGIERVKELLGLH
ncbi:PREDICTED: uncharacterized protein LOC104605271 [Nelumbo nucifera]|uniref:Uncharacterized protein LOC104605271 n=2 Tax=Nelumbo nucifera TaxID=4432 RepID=A0A1U8APY5_NELNU|nr:PREDICTED: uncharacterized protein LOC104605271 [Nelumbo nucifera]DAD25330.1 TPA_asm: hypothetical protein HUJ06_026794 [Nelumbo nucifera]